MPRLKLSLPDRFPFTATIPIRITDLNYGGHVGNDTVLTLLHEARVQFLKKLGYEELNVAGVGLIMSDVAIVFKQELFYGSFLNIHIAAGDFTRAGFDLFYKLATETNNREIIVAEAKTGLICFDYARRKVAALPAEALQKLQAL